MPILSDILSDSDEVKIPLGNGEYLTIEYYPSLLTSKLMGQIQHYSRQAEKMAGNEEKEKELLGKVYALLLSFFESWDLEDFYPCEKCESCRNGEKCESKIIKVMPLTAETLDNLPLWIFRAIIEKFIAPNQQAPQRKRRKNSKI